MLCISFSSFSSFYIHSISIICKLFILFFVLLSISYFKFQNSFPNFYFFFLIFSFSPLLSTSVYISILLVDKILLNSILHALKEQSKYSRKKTRH